MRLFKIVILILIYLSLNLCCITPQVSSEVVSLCPPHPDLLEKLKKEGRLEEIRKVLAKKPNYVDRPLPITKAVIGEKSAIVLLIQFPDKSATTPSSHFSDLLLSKGTYSSGSMRDYYLEASYGKLDINGDISGWYKAENNYADYIDNTYFTKTRELVKEAINKADPDVNFAQYDKDNDEVVDLLIVVHAGRGGEETKTDIWSHMSELPSPIIVDNKYITAYAMCPEDGKIGVFSHETGHLLGLPDLYDTDNSSAGIGNWSLMASGSWNNDGHTPAHLDAWCKIQLGWVTPHTVTTNINNAQIPQVETNPTIYKLWKDGLPGKEYFLVENRQKVGFDTSLPGSGLLIYHIDENIKDYYSDSNEWNKHQWYPQVTPLPYNHYLVAVEQADGNWELEKWYQQGYRDNGDLFDPYYSDKVFNDYSTPNSRAYNGNSTYVCVTNISNSQATMTAYLSITSLPKAFSLISPQDGSETKTLTLNFKWSTTTAYDGGTVTYILYYGTDSTFNTKATQTLTENTFSTTLVDNSTYYWKVKAVDKDGNERWSEQTNWKFYVNLFNELPGTPTLTSPSNGRIIFNLTPTFKWEKVFDPDPNDKIIYKLWYSKDADFTSKIEASVTTTFYTPSTPLDNNSTYYWKVFAVDNYGSETPSSGTFTLITRAIIVYPNPFYMKDKQITFAYLPDNSTIKIFTIVGELIKTLTNDNITGEAKWLPDDIASGIYLYVIESEGEMIQKGKLGILR